MARHVGTLATYGIRSSRRHDGRHVAIAPEMCRKTLNENMAAMCARHTWSDSQISPTKTCHQSEGPRCSANNISEPLADVLYQPCLGEGRRSRYRYTIELAQTSSRWRMC